MKFLSNILVKAGLVVEGTTDLQGTATTITQSSSDSSTKIATTAFVKNQGYAVGNVYTTDGSLSGNRTINLNGSYLDIAGLTTTRFFANGNVVIDGASPVDAGFKLDVAGTGRYTGILYANSRLNVNGATDSVNYQLNVTGRIRSSGQMESGAQVYGATGGIFNGVGIGAKTFTGPGYNYDTNNWIVASNSTTQPWAFYITNVQGINSISSRGAIIRFALTTTAGVEAGITNIQNNSDFAYVQFSGQYTTTAFGTQGEVYRVNRIDGQITDANARLFSWVGHTISPVLSSGLSNATIRGYFYNPTLTVTPANNIAFEATSGIMKLGNLAGTGTRMVVADSSGVLSTQAIPSGNAGTVTSIATTGPITGGTITSSGTIGITQATTSTDGYLSSTDWNTFNNKQAALGFTPVTNARTITINGTTFDLTANRSWSVGNLTGSLTSGYIPKATGSSSLADGLIYDTGSAVLIGTQTASSAKFMVYSTSPDNHYQAVGSAPSFRFADTINSPSYTGIFGLATASNHFIIGAAAGDMVLSNNTTSAIGNFIFGTGATERMRISPAGNVSINNTNNTYRFDVNGTVRFTGQLRLESTITNGTHTYTLPSATGTLALTSQLTGGTVTSVGLSSATSGVTIGSSPITTSGTITLAIATASGSGQGLLSSTDWTTFNNKQNALTNPVTGTGTTNYLPKFTGTSTIGNSGIVDNGGNIGINTASSAVELAVYSSSTARIQVQNSTTGVAFNDGFQFAISGSDGYVWNFENANIIFGTNNTAKMRLDASGNLGLGVTPSAGGLGGYVLFELANGGASIYSGPNQNLSGSNISWSGGTASYKISNFATLYNQQSGQHVWLTAPSGTAGNNISFTQAMTLDASGNLGVGATSVNSRLQVTAAAGLSHARWTESATTIGFVGGAQGIITGHNGKFAVRGESGLVLSGQGNSADMIIASTGAATFSSSVTATGGLISNGGSIGYGGGELGFGVTTSGATSGIYTLATGSPVLYFDHRATDNTGFWVWRNGSGAGSERMRLTSSGNLSIGNTNDTYKLDVSGASRILASTYTSGAILYLRDAAATGSNTTFGGLFLGSSPGTDFVLGKQSTNAVGSFAIKTGGGTTLFTLADTGAATFSSTIRVEGSYLQIANATNPSLYINNTSVQWQTYVKSNSNYAISDAVRDVLTLGYNGSASYFNGCNVGIGTTSPSSGISSTETTLQIQNGNVAALALNNSASRKYTIYSGVGGQLGFYDVTGGAERITLSSSGNVGIGTTSPASVGSYKVLDIQGSSGGMLYLSSNGSDGGRVYGNSGGLTYDAFAAGHTWYTPGGERMRITSGGNVGIGTTAPKSVFDVSGVTPTVSIVSNLNSEATTNNQTLAAITFYKHYGIANGAGIRMLQAGGVNNYAQAHLTFLTTNDGNPYTATLYERMRITDVGNVGIGTTSPSYLLDVNGIGRFSGGYQTPVAIFERNADYGQVITLGRKGVGADAGIGYPADSTLGFYTASTERMRITSGGSVAIGTSSVPSTNNKIVIQGNGNTNDDAILILNNNFNANSYTAIGSYYANGNTNVYSQVRFGNETFTGGGAFLAFATGNSERMRITSGGNLLVGTTSDNNSRIQVQGQVRTTGGYIFDNQTGSGNFTWYGFGGNIYALSSSVGNLVNINGSTGAYTAISDVNKKKDFELSNLGLDAVMGLKPTLYRMKSEFGTQKHLGFIAQEVRDYIPQAYAENNGFIGLTEMPIIAALTKAVQEQQAQIEELKSQLNK